MDEECGRTDQLLDEARGGRPGAFDALLAEYLEPLRRAVALRLDRRVSARVDVSDIVQETCIEAARRLPEYLAQRPMPFHVWLRWLARERVLTAHRQHLRADKRAVGLEAPLLPSDASAQFVDGLMASGPTPSQALAAIELADRLRLALAQLDDDEREIILCRHFESLSNQEVAALLGVSPAAASKRYIRALERLRGLLESMGISRSG